MSPTRPSQVLHATAVVIDGAAVLIVGLPGSGKSDLGLRLLGEGARLLADDRTRIEAAEGRLIAACPAAIAGLVEVRGLGVVRLGGEALPADETVPVALVVELVPAPGAIERLPDPETRELLGIPVPAVRVYGFAASATRVVAMALDVARGRRTRVD